MIRNEIKQLKTCERELRRFGLLVGGVFAVLGLLFWLRHKSAFPYLFIPGALLIAFGLSAPRLLKQVYVAWMTLAIVLGLVVSNVILTLFFFLVVTPIGLVARLFGEDFLSLKLERKAGTYWVPRKRTGIKTQSEYEQQF
jgi:glucose-6-phosphate-specific signal transduction histidine kinase